MEMRIKEAPHIKKPPHHMPTQCRSLESGKRGDVLKYLFGWCSQIKCFYNYLESLKFLLHCYFSTSITYLLSKQVFITNYDKNISEYKKSIMKSFFVGKLHVDIGVQTQAFYKRNKLHRKVFQGYTTLF